MRHSHQHSLDGFTELEHPAVATVQSVTEQLATVRDQLTFITDPVPKQMPPAYATSDF